MPAIEPLVLASTSASRAELLSRLGLPFETATPDYEETAIPGLSPRDLALHHALGKARSVAAQLPNRLVIGSDQVAELGGEVIGKPGSHRAAVDQLMRMAGRSVEFHTGLAVLGRGREEAVVETFRVTLRKLSLEEVEAYVTKERPLSCAGSFRIEGLGIALMERLDGRDYTALIGLPLIALTGLLRRLGVEVLVDADQTSL